jgi:hypothetical protein
VSVADALTKSVQRFRTNITLGFDESIQRKIRAEEADITGEERILAGGFAPRGNVISFGVFKVQLIKEELSVHEFLNDPKRLALQMKPAGIDHYIAFIHSYPLRAAEHTCVCLNTRLFSQMSDYLQTVSFTASGNGFRVQALERPARVLLPGDLVLMRR